MQLFSKRYKDYSNRILRRRLMPVRQDRAGDNASENQILDKALRQRLKGYVKFFIRQKNIEQFLLVLDFKTNEHYLCKNSLDDLTNMELGYKMSDIYNLDSLSAVHEENDVVLLDLVEIVFFFALSKKREEFKSGINVIFKEEGDEYLLHDFIYVKGETGVRSIIPMIKDSFLQEKLSQLFSLSERNYLLMSQLGIEILNYLFSSPESSAKTKKAAQDLCTEIAGRWVSEPTKQACFSNLLSSSVKNAKSLSNDISEIRHTDKYSIPVDSPSYYKMVSYHNMSIIEFVILSLPEKFILDVDPEMMKKNYIDKFAINKNTEWVINKPEVHQGIVIDDLPF